MVVSKSLGLRHALHMKRRSLFIRSLWAGCLLFAGINHARILLQHGLSWDYGGFNSVSAAYWTSLTFLDPIVAALLFIRPRFGIAAAVVLIVTNVLHDLATIAHSAPAGELLGRASHPITLSKIGFMLFVVVTAKSAWVGALSSESGKRVPRM